MGPSEFYKCKKISLAMLCVQTVVWWII